MNVDISILKEIPLNDVKARLIIEPLAPLSMVSELPGSYYKSLMFPTKKMICGLFENILGWHFDLSCRNLIIKDIQKLRKKQKKDIDFKSYCYGSTYKPLLMEYFNLIGTPKICNFSNICSYDDLWSRQYSRFDSPKTHIGGSRCFDSEILRNDIRLINSLTDDNEHNTWFKNSKGKFAQFYTTPTKREYVHLNGQFEYDVEIAAVLYKNLFKACGENNIAYLGNSEGWVSVKIQKI